MIGEPGNTTPENDKNTEVNMKKIVSKPGLFGTVTHYDERGRKIGSSVKGSFITDHYNAKGHKVGRSLSGNFKTDHYGANGQRLGSSYQGGIESHHYSRTGQKIGVTCKGFGHSYETTIDN